MLVSIKIPGALRRREAELEIEWTARGNYSPATFHDPAENPEVEWNPIRLVIYYREGYPFHGYRYWEADDPMTIKVADLQSVIDQVEVEIGLEMESSLRQSDLERMEASHEAREERWRERLVGYGIDP